MGNNSDMGLSVLYGRYMVYTRGNKEMNHECVCVELKKSPPFTSI